MKLRKDASLFLFRVIFLTLLITTATILRADQSKLLTSCEINQRNMSCKNVDIYEDFKTYLIGEPFRIQFFFKNSLMIKYKKSYDHEFIREVRFNKNSKPTSKLVLEFNNPTIISNISYYKINDTRINLNIYFSITSEANYAVAKYILNKNDGNIFSLDNNVKILSDKFKTKSKKNSTYLLKKQNLKKTNFNKDYVVFIDPGHGGKDPGAIGQLGSLEKDVTLKASILLAKKLKKIEGILPILSRNKDVYLTLRKRTMLAKKNKADIFISIHADSSKNKKAKGISVFSLSDKASDREAQMLARRENEVDKLFENQEKIKDPLIYGNLIKMFQREAMNDSSFLAKNILLNLEKTKLAVNRGHRFAGFSVLKSYDIPSVLIEIGFLSNKQEEKKLLDSKYLDELSKGLANSIQNYFINYEN